jgi:hypothetical protein
MYLRSKTRVLNRRNPFVLSVLSSYLLPPTIHRASYGILD